MWPQKLLDEGSSRKIRGVFGRDWEKKENQTCVGRRRLKNRFCGELRSRRVSARLLLACVLRAARVGGGGIAKFQRLRFRLTCARRWIKSCNIISIITLIMFRRVIIIRIAHSLPCEADAKSKAVERSHP
jgi:hypothetical protein